jgi:hypothetical protein
VHRGLKARSCVARGSQAFLSRFWGENWVFWGGFWRISAQILAVSQPFLSRFSGNMARIRELAREFSA